jgi:exosortase/archaeosortase family protein
VVIARRFMIRFVSIAAVLLALYYFPYPAGGVVKRVLDAYLHAYAVVSAAVIGLFEPGVRVSGVEIVGRYALRIVKTCDAMDVKTLFVAAVLAWPAPWRRRLAAAASGVALLFVVNVIRISSLYFVGLHLPSAFETIHLELWPIVMIAIALGTFVVAMAWMNGTSLASLLPARDDGPS